MTAYIDIKPAQKRVRVTLHGQVIADTSDALALKEGDVSYFSIKDGPENAVWSYERPLDKMTAIKGYLAFYPNKVTIGTE